MIDNTLKLESILKKKNNVVCYHTVCEFVDMGESLTTHIDGKENPADLLTIVICSGKRQYIVDNILHDVYNGEF